MKKCFLAGLSYIFFILNLSIAAAFPPAIDFDKPTLRKCLSLAESTYEGHLISEELWMKSSLPLTVSNFSARTGGVFGNKDHTQFGLCVAQGNRIFIGFRGTDFSQIHDILSDSDIKGHNLQNEDYQDGRFSHHIIGGTSETGVGRCHLGFLKIVQSCTKEIRRFVTDYATTQQCTVDNLQVTFTGHSLGAALSILSAADLINVLYERTNTENNVSVVTFAAPRVFNGIAAKLSDSLHLLRRNHKRFYIANDPVAPHPKYFWVDAHWAVSSGRFLGSLIGIKPGKNERTDTQHTGNPVELLPIEGCGSHRLSTYRLSLTQQGLI